MPTRAQLSEFLARVERRAYKHALYAVRDEHAALDIVQDAMLKLAERYGDKPAEELPMLFHRVLQNTINDHFRRQKVRSFWFTLFSSFTSPQSEEEIDPLDMLQDEGNASQPALPDAALQKSQSLAEIEAALQQLPSRQRQAFLLRYMDELSQTETANAMGCTEGSVKTHCSRAVRTLSQLLKNKGDAPR